MAYLTGTYFAPFYGSGGRNYRLVGYWLNSSNCYSASAGNEIKNKLSEHCSHQGCELVAVECDNGASAIPMRAGLWRALRKIVCERCSPRSMPLSFMSFSDFLSQAMSPCYCGSRQGFDGLLVSSLRHICNDPNKLGQLILRLAAAGKHLYAEDGVCLSCCHPASIQKLADERSRMVS